MSELVGLGFTTSNARTGERISANATINGGTDLNFTGATTLDGYPWPAGQGFLFANVGVGPGSITLTAPGFKDRVITGRFPEDFPANVDYAMEPDGSAPSDLHLEQRGNDFVDANGKRIVFPGVDAFDDIYLRVNGRESELDALWKQSRDIGFVVRRMFCMGDAGDNQVFSLYPQSIGMTKYIDIVRSIVAGSNKMGFIPLLTYFVDAQRVFPNQSDRQRFDRDLNEGLVDCGKWLKSGGNEAFKNGFNPSEDVFDPGHGVIWSRGSDQEDVTPITNAPATELHATRTSFDRALMDTTASPPYMRSKGARACWMTEGNPFGDANGYTPEQAWQLGRGYSINWALAVFHDRQSQRGQLMHDDTAACAREWVRGMSGV